MLTTQSSSSVADSKRFGALLAHSAAITVVSPASNLFQVTKLYGLSFKAHLRLLPSIIPAQVALRFAQVNVSTPLKEAVNPWACFGAMGILQGGVYGHANTHFAAALRLSSKPTIRAAFRGPGFAATRDMISQGLPFVLSDRVGVPGLSPGASRWVGLVGLSLTGTLLSHPLHLCQVLMQTKPGVTHIQAFKHVVATYGVQSFTKGLSSRMVLLLFTNILNEVFLKPIWEADADAAAAALA